jgi:hypothetical protein
MAKKAARFGFCVARPNQPLQVAVDGAAQPTIRWAVSRRRPRMAFRRVAGERRGRSAAPKMGFLAILGGDHPSGTAQDVH